MSVRGIRRGWPYIRPHRRPAKHLVDNAGHRQLAGYRRDVPVSQLPPGYLSQYLNNGTTLKALTASGIAKRQSHDWP